MAEDEWADFPKVTPSGDTAPPAAQDEFSGLPMVKPVPTPVYHGTIAPFTRYSDDTTKFDPLGAGPIGSLYGMGKDFIENAKKAVTLPGRVLWGETQMPPLGASPDDPRMQNMAKEAWNFATIFGPNVNPMVRSGDRVIPGVTRVAPDMSRATVPTSAELKAAGGQQLNAVRELPVRYDPAAVGDLANVIEQDLIKQGIFPESSKQLYKTLDRMRASQAPVGETVHFEPANLMALRENVAKLFERPKEHQKGVGTAFEHINNFIENPPASAVLAGPASDLGALYAKGRANYAAGLRGEDLANIRRTADLRAASANSGQNLDNTLRSRITSAILNDNRMRGFTPEEVARLEAIPEGSRAANLFRGGGNLLGGGGGLGATVTSALGAGAASALGASPGVTAFAAGAAPALGYLLKGRAASTTAGALREAEEATRSRSPLFREQAATQDLISGNPGRDAMARFLLNRATQPSAPPSFSRPPNVRPEDYI